MIDDLKKSFNEIIYERTTSPFYGTLITSWLIWNWRILYLSFFISENKIKENKIDYIITKYSDIEHILIFPLISTFFLITVIPFISNGAFWMSLKFNKWKIDQKNIVDKKQLLSVEQSIELREEISKQEERFAKLVESKNLEIKQLNLQIDEYKKQTPPVTLNDVLNSTNNSNNNDISELSERLKKNAEELKKYEVTVWVMQMGYQLSGRDDVDSKFIALLESYEIIENKGKGVYEFTKKGKELQRIMIT